MKRFRTVLLALVCMFCLSGCVRFNATIDVKKNGKVDVSMIYAAMSLEDYGYEGNLFDESVVEGFKDDGWEVEPYSSGDFTGYRVFRDDVAIKDIVDSLNDKESDVVDMNSFRFTKDGFKYVIAWDISGVGELDQIQAYKTYFDMTGGSLTVDVNLPVKPTAHNATKVSDDGKSLEWDLLEMDGEGIHLEFSLFSFLWIFILCGIGFALAVIVIIAIIVADRSKRNKNQITYNGNQAL